MNKPVTSNPGAEGRTFFVPISFRQSILFSFFFFSTSFFSPFFLFLRALLQPGPRSPGITFPTSHYMWVPVSREVLLDKTGADRESIVLGGSERAISSPLNERPARPRNRRTSPRSKKPSPNPAPKPPLPVGQRLSLKQPRQTGPSIARQSKVPWSAHRRPEFFPHRARQNYHGPWRLIKSPAPYILDPLTGPHKTSSRFGQNPTPTPSL